MDKNISILIVDDDIHFGESTVDILTEIGYQCFQVRNGQEAVEALKNQPIDLILSDIKMPIMNGVDMVKMVRVQYPRLRIILMTAFRDETLMQDARKQDVEGIIHKPLDIDELINLIEQTQ